VQRCLTIQLARSSKEYFKLFLLQVLFAAEQISVCLSVVRVGGVSCSASVSEVSLSPCWEPVSPINSLRNLNLDRNNCQTTYQPAGNKERRYRLVTSYPSSQLSGRVYQENKKEKKKERLTAILITLNPNTLCEEALCTHAQSLFYSPIGINSV